MNYRHAYHAGNFADVFKHIVLMRLVEYLKRKDKAFRVYDTHAGIGLYDLTATEAAKTGEWISGIGKLAGAPLSLKFEEIAKPYLDVVRELNPDFDTGTITRYPGSPYLTRQLLRKQDRLAAYELHKEDILTLKANFEDDYQTRITHLDGWLVPASHVPPKEKRGLIFVDPPFEDGMDFERCIEMLKTLHKRWREGMAVFWFPIKHEVRVNNFLKQAREVDGGEMMLVRFDVSKQGPQEFTGSAMIIKNPPYTLESEIIGIGKELCALMGIAKQAHISIKML